MLPSNDLNNVCSVAEMAAKVGLFRARFYQLQKAGVFPQPVYCIRTKRPFYSLDLQQKCIQIRKTGIGLNGQPVLFNRPRNNSTSKDQLDRKYKELAQTLKTMGLNVTNDRVKNAVDLLHPQGLSKQPIDEQLIRDLFKYFSNECHKSV